MKISCGNSHSLMWSTDGTLFGWGSNSHGQISSSKLHQIFNPSKIMVDKEILQIYCGENQSLILRRNGEVVGSGELKLGHPTSIGNDVRSLKSVKLCEPILCLPGHKRNPPIWNYELHSEFDDNFREIVFIFLLCLKRAVPIHFIPPRPVISFVLNLSIS